MVIVISYSGIANNMLDPAAYVQRIKIPSEGRTQAVTAAMLADVALNRSPNYKHRDGRIYASGPSEPYFAVTVSPLNPAFETQIEPGIKPVVEALLAKNYLPVSSCQGHNDSRAFVRIAFGTTESRDNFIREFGVMPYVSLCAVERSANIIQYWDNGKPHWRAQLETDVVRQDLESQDINNLYRRNYTQVCYADIMLYDTKEGIWNFISRQRIINDMRKNKSQRLAMIADRIRTMQDYEL